MRHALAALLLLAGCANASGATLAVTRSLVGAQAVSVPAQGFPTLPGVRAAPAPLPGRLVVPEGAGPFPAVVLLHGCGGVSRNMVSWAERLVGWGYAALILDSFGPRGVRNVCVPSNPRPVTVMDRAGDALDGALFLRSHAGIDPARIFVLGTSHGGAAAFNVTQRAFQDAAPGLVRASVVFYANCRNAAAHGTVPLLLLGGEADDWGDYPGTCLPFAAALRPDQPFALKTYPGAVHGFDDPHAHGQTSAGHVLDFDPAAAADSYARVRSFLDGNGRVG